jgi:hypothetical protein
MKVDCCINKLGDGDVYLGSYSISGWTSPMTFSGITENEVIEKIKENIIAMFSQSHIKMYSLNFPDINFPQIECHSPIKKKRGRPKKQTNTTLVPKLSALIPRKNTNAK